MEHDYLILCILGAVLSRRRNIPIYKAMKVFSRQHAALPNKTVAAVYDRPRSQTLSIVGVHKTGATVRKSSFRRSLEQGGSADVQG